MKKEKRKKGTDLATPDLFISEVLVFLNMLSSSFMHWIMRL